MIRSITRTRRTNRFFINVQHALTAAIITSASVAVAPVNAGGGSRVWPTSTKLPHGWARRSPTWLRKNFTLERDLRLQTMCPPTWLSANSSGRVWASARASIFDGGASGMGDLPAAALGEGRSRPWFG